MGSMSLADIDELAEYYLDYYNRNCKLEMRCCKMDVWAALTSLISRGWCELDKSTVTEHDDNIIADLENKVSEAMDNVPRYIFDNFFCQSSPFEKPYEKCVEKIGEEKTDKKCLKWIKHFLHKDATKCKITYTSAMKPKYLSSMTIRIAEKLKKMCKE